MIESTPKPFPTYEDSHQKINELVYHQDVKGIYDYFAQFGVRPSRLEQLKARKSELSREELLELVELMEGNDG